MSEMGEKKGAVEVHASVSTPKSKKRYVPPTLTHLGSVRSLTFGTGSQLTDGASPAAGDRAGP